jgi:hypothetical protein
MATVEDYGSGRILRLIRIAHLLLKVKSVPAVGGLVLKFLEQRISPLGIHPVTHQEAGTIIEGSRCCALGTRVCIPLFPVSPVSEAVFLDELAERMVTAGKARIVPKKEAKETLRNYPKNPVILSRVSGRYQEICCSDPETCIYWTMKRSGLKV